LYDIYINDQKVELEHCPQEANNVAHGIARYSFHSKSSYIWVDKPLVLSCKPLRTMQQLSDINKTTYSGLPYKESIRSEHSTSLTSTVSKLRKKMVGKKSQQSFISTSKSI
jgi:hypothetical protein